MSKKTLYKEKYKKTIKKSSKKTPEKMFDFLHKHKGESFSRDELAKKLGVTPPTISRAYQTLKDQSFGKTKTYQVFLNNGLYKVDSPENIYNKKEEPVTDIIEEEAKKLANPNIWLSDFADTLTSTVVLYKIKSRYRSAVKNSLTKLFNDNIHAILERKNELYIIIKENSNTKRKTMEGICKLYESAVKLSVGY